MNQQALASVLLRVYGIYIVYSTIAMLGGSILLTPTGYMDLIRVMASAFFIQLFIGVVLIILSGKFSKFFFSQHPIAL